MKDSTKCELQYWLVIAAAVVIVGLLTKVTLWLAYDVF